MGAYFQNYGAGDEQRARFVKRAILGIAAALVLLVAAFLYFRNYKEEHFVKQFLGELNDRQFDAAYRTWGCTDAHPCRDYDHQKFLEDWGPQKSSGGWKVTGVEGCSTGTIVQVSSSQTPTSPLWVQRSADSLTFSPWNECQGKKWRFRQFFQRLMGKGD